MFHLQKLFLTMPAKDELSDDYVASLLAKDAKTSNVKYSTYGLQELLPRRLLTIVTLSHVARLTKAEQQPMRLNRTPGFLRTSYERPTVTTLLCEQKKRESLGHVLGSSVIAMGPPQPPPMVMAG